MKPSPAQARVLRYMQQHPEVYLRVWYGSVEFVPKSEVDEGKRWPRGWKAGASRATMMSCIRMGWLTRSSTAPTPFYGGEGADLGHYLLSDVGARQLLALTDQDFISRKAPPGPSVDGEAARVLRALALRHDLARGWIFFPEAPTGIDAFAVNCYASQRNERVGYEIKVSRSDFLKELRSPEKTKRSAAYCNRFYFACPSPPDVIKPKEVPDPYGLVYVSAKGRSRIVKRATWVDQAPGWRFVGLLLRRLAQMEGHDGTADTEDRVEGDRLSEPAGDAEGRAPAGPEPLDGSVV